MKDPKAFADAYQFTIALFLRTRSFPKHLRPTLGRRLEEESMLLTTCLRKALMSPIKSTKGTDHRLAYLQKSSDSMDDIRVFLRMSHDLNILPVSSFHELSLLGQEVGREIGGLIKVAKINNQAVRSATGQSGDISFESP